MENIPKLLIENYNDDNNLPYKIINNNYSSLNNEVPMCRFRGTVIYFNTSNDSKGIKIVGWQRNISRLRKMDVSLPTIITIDLNNEGIIKDIDLDSSFKGSKGLLCSHKYLKNNLKEKCIGLKIDKNFIKKVKLESLHCSHLVEVAGGIFSYYHFIKNNLNEKLYSTTGNKGVLYEEEVIDNFVENGTLYFKGVHLINGHKINYTFQFHDILKNISFDRLGNINRINEVKIDFIVNNKLVLSEVMILSGHIYIFNNLQKFLLRCLKYMSEFIGCEHKIRILHTNLYPSAFVGLLVQALSMQMFKNNYNYVMHVLTAIQRPNGIPQCVGALNDQNEANKYFPGFNFSDLI